VHFSLFVGVRGGIVFVVFVGQQVELEELKKPAPPTPNPAPLSIGVVQNGSSVNIDRLTMSFVIPTS
jgi:hypothetical protein